MKRKINLVLSFIACISLFTISLRAQTAADIGMESTLEDVIISSKNEAHIDIAEEKTTSKIDDVTENVLALPQNNTKQNVAEKATKRQAKLEKLLNSKFGQWLVKRATIKAHKKEIRKQLNTFEGDKAAKKAYKEELKKEVLKTKAMNSNVRTGIILIAVGIILTILPVDILRIVGSIVIVIGLVFLILGLI